MKMKHVLFELYCDFDTKNQVKKPVYCCEIGVGCVENRCKYLSYTYCPNEIAYAGAQGIVESFEDCIGFGGEMEPKSNDIKDRESLLKEWKFICKKKIDEAYIQYLELKEKKEDKTC